jgi:hypothetical protein
VRSSVCRSATPSRQRGRPTGMLIFRAAACPAAQFFVIFHAIAAYFIVFFAVFAVAFFS